MDIEKFKKLEESIKEESFDKEYKNINNVMFGLSIFGHVSSIFLAYFLLSKVLTSAITNNPALVLIASIIMLSGLELLKRDIFQKLSSQSIKLKTFAHKNVYPLLAMSILVIGVSFYATISGAKEFSSKAKEIEVIAEQSTKKYTDSLTTVYNNQIKSIELDSKNIKSKLDQKDAEQTSLEAVQPLTPQQRNRVRDLKSEKDLLRSDITKLDTTISNLKSELSNKTKEYEIKIHDSSLKNKKENSNNSLLFVVISTMIELIILAGVYFNRYYKIRTYNDYRDKIDKDPNYQKWVLYSSIINIIYNTDTKVNDKAPSIKTILELSKLNGYPLLTKDANDLVKMLTSLGIIKSTGNARYFIKSKESAKEIIKQHFNIK